MADVQKAYRETILVVPHYEEEYAEPLVENMAQEFGVDFYVSDRK